MAEKITTALLQADLEWENIKKNREKLQERIEDLSSAVDIIVLPEMFTTGFSMNAAALSEPEPGGSLNWMQEIARKKDAAVTGSLIITENGAYFNRLYFVFPDGSYKKYDKRHTFTLAREHETYSAGTERLLVEFRGWKICPLVCYDLRFPVWSRNTEEFDVLIYVANWPSVRVAAWDALLKARAIENLCYCLGVNRTGQDGNGHSYPGHSSSYDCLGSPLFQPDRQEEFLHEVVLERSHITEVREKLRFLQDRDRFTIN